MRFLIIQTSFIGDVVLATSVVEKLHQKFPDAKIDFLLRKGNESLLENHPFLNKVITWDKKQNKLGNLFKTISLVRQSRYDRLINLHRYASTGLITALSGAKEKIGFDKNPFSFFYTKKIKHEIGDGKHEIERNQELISDITDSVPAKPKLYPSKSEFAGVSNLKLQTSNAKQYICIAPASVWFTKQLPKEKWIEVINLINKDTTVYLIGAGSDLSLCSEIIKAVQHPHTINLAGNLSFLESAALMKGAAMNYVNDCAPLHIAGAMNAPVTAIFCSTSPIYGFGPLSDSSKIVETKITLDCKPCGLHGFKACPKGHFKCELTIEAKDLLS
jgi:lipopolysaccharide heptosyltransferase II